MNKKKKPNSNNGQRQRTLAGYITRETVHRDKRIPFPIPEEVPEEARPIPCPNNNCRKRFPNKGSLKVHMKFVHPDDPDPCESSSSSTSTKPSTVQNSQESDVVIQNDVDQVVKQMVDKVATKMGKSDGGRSLTGKKKHKYGAGFKAQAIQECNEMTQQEVATKYRVKQSQISKWISQKDQIFADAANNLRKLLTRGRKATKHLELYNNLWEKFVNARAKGHLVNFNWLLSKARVIQKNLNDTVIIEVIHLSFIEDAQIEDTVWFGTIFGFVRFL